MFLYTNIVSIFTEKCNNLHLKCRISTVEVGSIDYIFLYWYNVINRNTGTEERVKSGCFTWIVFRAKDRVFLIGGLMSGGGGMIKSIVTFYRESGIFSEDQVQLINYAIKSILSDISKLLILLALAVLADTVFLFGVVTVTFVSVRVLLGGIHMRTYWGCLIATICIFSLIILLSIVGHKLMFIFSILTVLSFIGVVKNGPVISIQKRRVLQNKRQILKCLIIGLEVMYLSLGIFVIQTPEYRSAVLLSLLVNNLQNFILSRKERKLCVN